MNDIYSFYQLISKYRIEIPIIQRDYAQGRNNAKAVDVRKSLVGKMINAVENENESLFFDFVYGRVDENKFIPFDGQQRLTTLFLFHKYVFEKCQSVSDCRYKGNCICKEILGRFSYATRQSSREFCEELVKHNVIPNSTYRKLLEENYKSRLKEDDKEKDEKTKTYIDSIDNWIYRYITNQPWFYPDWQKDSTVMGMLTMLDEIHNQMNGKERFKNFAEKLTSGCDCPITFHFVDMGEHKLSDETYVKMNARGKQLTPFENFKASLEQYIEEKKKEDDGNQKTYDELLIRLKGKYDETSNKYTGIDGTWLELFWEVAKKYSTEKELPDSLMMSFFNRHFMNVWRCWYAFNFKNEKEISKIENVEDRESEQKKQGNYKTLNERITKDKEFPLYPTKDKFVPFEIYRDVLESCGIDPCLTPIFNIFDALCKERDNIERYCQAVWNREPEAAKWILYKGVQNKDNNRETYPSRVAFYALMKYFGIKAYQTGETSLSSWMHVVWNIIENSTIDSPDRYQAALRLIDKLSVKSHSIYEALANEFDSFGLGNQYHAQDQVIEEKNKAIQIIDEVGKHREYKGINMKQNGSKYQIWEEIIEDAEKYAFFKGAIRFLFQDENGKVDKDNSGTWNTSSFDKKWENAKKYFDKNGNGIEEEYKVQLTKLLVIQCDDWNEQLYDKQIFNPDSSTWKWILTAKNWTKPIHNILVGEEIVGTKENNDKNVEKHITPLLEELPFKDMIKYVPNGRFKWYYRLAFYYNKSDVITFDWDNFHRNKILSELADKQITIVENERTSNFFWGWSIQFKYNNHRFQWHRDNYVRMIDDSSECKPKLRDLKQGDQKKNWYYFNTDTIDDTSLFQEKLDCLIAQAGTNDSEKMICQNCQEKICEQTE